MPRLFAYVAALFALAVGVFELLRRLLSREHRVGDAIVRQPTDDTHMDERGAVKSVQGAEIDVPAEQLEDEWKPENLERLARTYWAFLSTVTLGLIRVRYTDQERYVTLVFPWLRLLTFKAPVYDVNENCGNVRWDIDKGFLVASQGRGRDGYLEIDVRRRESENPERGLIYVQTTVANFYPQMAHFFSRFFYTNTQSRAHVIVAYGFFRRIARGDLDESVSHSFEREQALDDAPA